MIWLDGITDSMDSCPLRLMSEQAPGNGEGQGRLGCCSPWGHKKSDMTEQLKNNNRLAGFFFSSSCFLLSLVSVMWAVSFLILPQQVTPLSLILCSHQVKKIVLVHQLPTHARYTPVGGEVVEIARMLGTSCTSFFSPLGRSLDLFIFS